MQQTSLLYGNSNYNTSEMNPQENNRLDYMAAELDALKSDMSEVKQMVKDMHTLLTGNPIDKDADGLIGDFRQVKKEFYTLKAEIKKYKNYFYAMVTLISLGALKLIIEFLKSL
jgi:predicted phage-related endonuclease